MSAFLATADPIGLCPVTALTASGRPGANWDLARAICSAYTGDGPPAMAQLDRLMRRGGPRGSMFCWPRSLPGRRPPPGAR
jgi:hypothetical protein